MSLAVQEKLKFNDFLKNYEIIENQLKSMTKLEKNSVELRDLNKKLKSYSEDLEREVNQKTKDLRFALEEISKRVEDKEKQVQKIIIYMILFERNQVQK